MPSSYSLRFKYELPATGELSGTWGNTVNNAITTLLDETIDAVSNIAMANANQTLTIPNGASSPNRARTYNVTGAHTAIRTLTVPSGDGTFRVINSTTGGFNIAVKTPSSGSIQIEPGFEGYFVAQGASLNLSNPRFGNLLSSVATISSLNAQFIDGSVSAPSFNFASDPDTGIYRVGANSLGFSAGATNVVTMTSALTTVTSNLTMSRTGSGGNITISAPAGTQRNVIGQTAGSSRWQLVLGSNDAETGSDAGSSFSLFRYDDAGTVLGQTISALRATGDVAVTGAAISGIRFTVSNAAAEAVVNPRTARLTNLNTANDVSASLEFGFAAAGLAGQIRGRRNGAANSGNLILSAGLTGSAVDVLTLASTGNATFAADCAAITFTTLSDRRAKAEIEPFDLGLDAIMRLEPATFRLKKEEGGRRHVGLIAQDVEATPLGPHMVHGEPDGMLSLEPNVVIYALINAVKELRAEIIRLKGYP